MTNFSTPDTTLKLDPTSQNSDSEARKSQSSPFAATSKATALPFAAVSESTPPPIPSDNEESADSPTKPDGKADPAKSPFQKVAETTERPAMAFRPAKIPEKRKQESPFKVADASEGFGGSPPMLGTPLNPADPAYPAPSPFVVLSDYPGYAHLPPHNPYAGNPNYPYGYPQPGMAPFSPQHAHSFPPSQDGSAFRQIELRAIFGVDHEMGMNEIIQRCRTLPGVRDLAYIGGQESNSVESLKALIAKLGYESSELRICAGQVPLEFIQEGRILLAVQTDGGFPPGVRETLIIVAREMARLV